MKSMPPIEWYLSDDLMLGFCGLKGNLGVYCYWLDQGKNWQFCPPETRLWDCYHQKVYFRGRADPCDFEDLVGRVPPLPTQFPPPAQYHVADPPEPPTPHVKPGSRVFEKVNAATGRRLPVYVVLREDKYESAVGDGIFRYFDSAFFDRSAAELSVAELLRSSDTYTYYIRKVSLAISNKDVILDTEGCALSPFDYFTRQEICEDLARGIPRGTD